jgi:hypothetical protein
MNCEQFFLKAIDPDEEPTEDEKKEIAQHRETCAACRKAEEDHLVVIGRPVYRKEIKPARADFEAKLLATHKAHLPGGNGRRAPWKSLGMLFLGCLLGGGVVAAALGARGAEAPQASQQTGQAKQPEKQQPGEAKQQEKKPEGTKFDELGPLPSKQDMLGGDEKPRNPLAGIDVKEQTRKRLVENMLKRYRVLAKSDDQAIQVQAHLGTMDALQYLGRNDEIELEAQAVIDNPKATEQEKKIAKSYLPDRVQKDR